MQLKMIIGLFWVCISLVAQNNEPVLEIANDHFNSLNINAYTSLLIDDSGTLTIEEVLKREDEFTLFDSIPEYNYPTAHWLRLHINVNVDSINKWIIFKYPSPRYPNLGSISYVDAYYFRNEQLSEHHRTGAFVPKKEKTIQERALVNALPLKMTNRDSLIIYIRTQRISSPLLQHLELELIDPDDTISLTIDRHKIQMGASLGAHLFIGAFIFFFFIATKKWVYFYFAIYAFLMAFHLPLIEPQGRFVDSIIPNNPHLGPILFSLITLSYMFILLFGRKFTELSDRHPKWDKYLLIVIMIVTVWSLCFIYSFIHPPYINFTTLFFVVLILLLPLCIRLVMDQHFPSRLFAIGIFWLLFWNCIGILWNFQIIKLPFLPWTVGQLGFLLIYGVGLGYNLMRTEKEKARAQHLKELDSIKSKFFANISHEFRTPLSLILGPINQASEGIPSSELIDDSEELPVKTKNLRVMKRNALRLQNLVDQLLDLSKLDSGKMQLKIRNGKIIQFIRSIISSFELTADQRHIQFNTGFPSEISDAYFDSDKLEKIIVNLLANAFKFTPDYGNISVHVEESSNRIKIIISDSGKGIPKEELDQIFNRFYQMEGTESKGTGIGLALVKEIVDLHKGHISVTSTIGQGSEFKVSLPIKRSEFTPNQIDLSISSIEEKLHSQYNQLHDEKEVQHNELVDSDHFLILLAEDNTDLRNYIGDSLKKDYNLIITKDGKEALRKAVSRIPDLIISDVMMPKMNGYELCEKIKTNEKTSHIPVILLTAKAGQEDRLEGLSIGADDYLTKPFDMRELKIRIKNLINQRIQLRGKFHGELKIQPTAIHLNSMDEKFISAVMEEIEKNMSNEFYTVEDLAHAVNFSRSQLNRKIKALTDKTSNQMIRDFRLTRAKEMLEQNAATVSQVAYEVGYSNLSYFAKSFKTLFGILPSEVKK